MAFHRAGAACGVLIALTCALLSGWCAPAPADAQTIYAATVAPGEKGRWPYCGVTGWKPVIYVCPPRTTCKVSWVDGHRSASNCYKPTRLRRCTLERCAWLGAAAKCRDPYHRFPPRFLTCGEFAERSRCVPSVVCNKKGEPVCDSNRKRWGNACFLEKGLCAQGFAEAYGPVLGNC